MGRRRKDPREQKARGFPNRRKAKTQRALDQIEKMEAKAAEDAKLLAAGADPADLQALPVFIKDKRLAPAIEVWKEYAPRLDKLQLLTTLDRHTFAMFCIYVAEFALANRDVLDNGYTIMVTTVAGSKSKSKDGNKMPRLNPSVDRRDHAAKMMLDLAEKFGFTPLDRAKLIHANAMRFDEETLFGRARPAQVPPPAQPDAAAEVNRGAAGSARSLDSAPPGSRPN